MEKLNDKWFRLIGIPTVAFLAQSLFFTDMLYSGRYLFWKVFGVSILVAMIIWETNRQVFIVVRRQLPGIKNTWRRLIALFFSLGATTFVVSTLLVFLMNDVWQIWGYRASWRLYMLLFVIRFTIVILITAIYESIYFFRQWKQIYLESLALKRENLQTELDALIAQVNPHFLFHSLNSLSALIEEDKKLAVQFVDELARVYRYLLQNTDHNWVTLDTELRFAQDYLFILKMRFGEGLVYQERIAEDCRGYQLPPLTLKTLIENAIAHNIISVNNPLSILVFTDLKQQLVVSHNVQPKTLLVKRRRQGLTNLAKKFQLLTDTSIEIAEDDRIFEIKLPLIKTI
jgi:hypothetical protein